MEEERKINITQICSWLSAATSNKKFLLKPTDLRLLYTLVLWEYLSKYHDANTRIVDDTQIAIPEKDLVHMIGLLFGESYKFFDRVNNM